MKMLEAHFLHFRANFHLCLGSVLSGVSTWYPFNWPCVVQVGLFKALATGGQPTSLIQQDLQLGEGGGLEAGDSVEAKYTGWLLSNNTFGRVSLLLHLCPDTELNSVTQWSELAQRIYMHTCTQWRWSLLFETFLK